MDLSILTGKPKYRPTISTADRLLADALAELARRSCEALPLYQPLPAAARFHACPAKWRVLDGSNRSGKTFAAAVEFCRALLGVDPYGKYVPRLGSAIVVGLSWEHIAGMWEKCFQPGQFKVLPDERTGLLRAVRWQTDRPDLLDPYDAAYREKWRDAPPLIPPRLLPKECIAWENRAKGQPRMVMIPATGWKAHFYSSDGAAPRGQHYNAAWFDEQIVNDQFYSEVVRGLVAIHEPPGQVPRGVWSATPQDCHPLLAELREKSDAGSENVRAFQLYIADNPFIPADEKQEFIESTPEDERATRIYGEYAVAGSRVYPHFSPQGVHGCEPNDVPYSELTHFAAIDPGITHAGLVLAGIDHDERHLYLYYAADIKRLGADGIARKLAEWQLRTGVRFEAAVMDQRAGKQTPLFGGPTVAEQYWRVLEEQDVTPRRRGPLHGFFPGSDDVAARTQALITLMQVRDGGAHAGTPKLRYVRGCCPELETQIKRAVFDLDKPDRRKTMKVEDILQALEYLAAFRVYYEPPERVETTIETPTQRAWREKQQRKGRH